MTKKLHIGIILDGNRRYAQQQGNRPWEGHHKGADKVEQLFSLVEDLPIREVTLYAWSMQNFERDELEKKFIFELFLRSFKKLLQKKEKLEKKGICIRFLGRLYLFPKKVQQKMQEIMDLTKNNKKITLNFCMAYGGREEIIDAVSKIVNDVKKGNLKKIDEKELQKRLYIVDEPDFIIRTSGEQRTSNFLMWQSAYSEWFFLNKFWPEIEKTDIKQCIDQFFSRDRRFGK